ncbi:DUF1700 domain-containing protein [Streptomyces sp. NPDC015032]|uniref:DUF1700 domain-containing protein n=1 Tax=Streptomyces sp. NPDC015032 TaxID=3364937 RepID=UPI0036F748DF
MMKTEDTEDALVRQYLAAVERETSALPAERRQELVADLSEHIETALAERPGSSREILRELGDPRTIAATALQESGPGAHAPSEAVPEPATGKAARRRSPAWVVAWLPLITFVPGQLWGPLGLVFRIIGVVVLCRSRYWTWEQKWVGVTLTAFVPSAVAIAFNLGLVPLDPPAYVRWLVMASMAALALGSSAWLWKVRKD